MTHKENRFKPKQLSHREQLLVSMYAELDCPLDRLAYTPKFELLHKAYALIFGETEEAELLRTLYRLRKSGRLIRTGRSLATLVEEDRHDLLKTLEKVYGPEFSQSVQTILNHKVAPNGELDTNKLITIGVIRMLTDNAIEQSYQSE